MVSLLSVLAEIGGLMAFIIKMLEFVFKPYARGLLDLKIIKSAYVTNDHHPGMIEYQKKEEKGIFEESHKIKFNNCKQFALIARKLLHLTCCCKSKTEKLIKKGEERFERETDAVHVARSLRIIKYCLRE